MRERIGFEKWTAMRTWMLRLCPASIMFTHTMQPFFSSKLFYFWINCKRFARSGNKRKWTGASNYLSLVRNENLLCNDCQRLKWKKVFCAPFDLVWFPFKRQSINNVTLLHSKSFQRKTAFDYFLSMFVVTGSDELEPIKF